MSATGATFDSFQTELHGLVTRFQNDFAYFQSDQYDEAMARLQFIDPFFASLGWDMENRDRPAHECEVIIERRTDIEGRHRRADYVFRIGGMDKLVCDAKKPGEQLQHYAFQIQRYTYSLGLYLGLLTDFENLQIYVVGAKPDPHRPFDVVRVYRFQEYEKHAKELWDLFARDNIANGSIDKFIVALPKTAARRAKQGWLIKPDRTRIVDDDFLAYLDEARSDLAKTLVASNPHFDWGDTGLNEAVQRILDRILFIRICEDRDIDTFRPLARLAGDWRAGGSQAGQLYPALVGLFRKLAPQFNGGLFGKPEDKPHFSESLKLDDAKLADFIEEISADDSSYLFSTIPVEILGAVYERFLGKVIRVTPGGTVKVELKPEVRKAGGVYYTPRYIVNYIVEQTVGKLLDGKSPKEVRPLKILDPACGSGSFLIRAFERICEHHAEWYHDHPDQQKPAVCYKDEAGLLRLTTGLKREILRNNIFGVDIDPQAVEVTQLSLYLKILEHETRNSLNSQRQLFPGETFLPDLSANIVCGNSVVGTDIEDGKLFKLTEEEQRKLRPMDFAVEFSQILPPGFDAVIGNPPWGSFFTPSEKQYLVSHYSNHRGEPESHLFFMERGCQLLNEGGVLGYITPNAWFSVLNSQETRQFLLMTTRFEEICELSKYIFVDAPDIVPALVFLGKNAPSPDGECVVRRATAIKVDASNFDRVLATTKIPQNVWTQTTHATINLRATSTVLDLTQKCRAVGIQLGDMCDVLYGIKTGDNSKFISAKPSPRHKMKALKTGELTRYGLTWKGVYLWWCKALAGYRESSVEVPKIVVQYIRKISLPRRLIAAFDEKGIYYPLNNYSYICQRDGSDYSLEYVLGIFNSSLINFYFANTFVDYNIKPTYLQQLPIRHIDFTNYSDRARHDKLSRTCRADGEG